jgi:hypothetical protein
LWGLLEPFTAQVESPTLPSGHPESANAPVNAPVQRQF